MDILGSSDFRFFSPQPDTSLKAKETEIIAAQCVHNFVFISHLLISTS